jgi:phage shock protein A
MENPVSKVKSFWERPEGFAGMLFGLGAVVAGGWALFKALPSIIVMMQNLYLAIGMGVGLLVILTILLDKRNWILAGAMYQSLMRKITGLFITIDPIGIIENYIRILKGKIEVIDKQLANLMGQKNKVKMVIDEAHKKMNESLKIARKAKQLGDKNQTGLHAKEAQRQKELAEQMEFIYNKIIFLYKVLSKIMENSEVILQDTENEVAIKKTQRKVWQATSSAIKSAQSVIMGDPDQRALFDASMEEVANDIAQKTGEMERFVDRSAKIMSTIDLRNGVMEDEGLALLEEWENESSSILLSEKERNLLLSESLNAADEIEEEVEVTT